MLDNLGERELASLFSNRVLHSRFEHRVVVHQTVLVAAMNANSQGFPMSLLRHSCTTTVPIAVNPPRPRHAEPCPELLDLLYIGSSVCSSSSVWLRSSNA
jgi:hypothetical protein